MGDGLKLIKDKRHRSSSSLSGVILEGTRSERKLEFRASIPEVDDQFALAEARCDDLQEKIDLVKVLKRKRRLKKKSTTKVSEEPPTPENLPFITVRTQPKKKVSQQAARLRRLEVPQNPTRGYLDPATVEQHRMIGQVRGYNNMYRQPLHSDAGKTTTQNKSPTTDQKQYSRPRPRRACADGDSMCGLGMQLSSNGPTEVACGEDDVIGEYSDIDSFDQRPSTGFAMVNKKPTEIPNQVKSPVNRRRHVPRDIPPKEVPKWSDDTAGDAHPPWHTGSSPLYRRRQPNKPPQSIDLVYTPSFSPPAPAHQHEERPVVELFNKSRASPPLDIRRSNQQTTQAAPLDRRTKRTFNVREPQIFDDQVTGSLGNETPPMEPKKGVHRHPRRVKYRSRRYEMPTVASQMKQAGTRYYYGNSNQTNIPFIVTKSTAPSHNIGVNIQQVLNGLKIQQPLSGIPLTIAHHMGLGHIPTYGTKSATMQPSLDNREINAIKLGQRLLRLPSYKYMSYNRLLTLYREGDGMVPKFLRAISRPHYFYTSMYNLATNREDLDGATSKGRGGGQEAKQSLAEYASLYREYEHIDKCIRDGNYEPELERRREELSRELAAREQHIRRVVQEYRIPGEQTTLRASASTAEDAYRHSSFKLIGDHQQ